MKLSKEDLEQFKKKLEGEEARLSKELKSLNSAVSFGSDVDHLEEETDETEEFVNRTGVEEKLQEELNAVRSALVRIQKKTYGTCTACNSAIERELLEANPASELCKSCKAKTR